MTTNFTNTEVNNCFKFIDVYLTNTKKFIFYFQYNKKWLGIKLLMYNLVSLAARKWIVFAILFGTTL